MEIRIGKTYKHTKSGAKRKVIDIWVDEYENTMIDIEAKNGYKDIVDIRYFLKFFTEVSK